MLKVLTADHVLPALVVGIYDDSIQPGQAASAVEKMAEYLEGQNY